MISSMLNFDATISSLIISLINNRFPRSYTKNDPKLENTIVFVIQQYRQMPDYARSIIWCLGLCLDALPLIFHFKPFHLLDHKERWQYIKWFKRARLAFLRDMIRFYEMLAIFAWYAELEVNLEHDYPFFEHTTEFREYSDWIRSGRGLNSVHAGRSRTSSSTD